MVKRVVAVACLTVSGFLGLALGGPGTVRADSGVGPSAGGVTGLDRACEVHAANNGVSNANGIECGGVAPSLTAGAATASTSFPGFCTFTVTGSGLAAGTGLTYTGPDETTQHPFYGGVPGSMYLMTVAPDGTLDGTAYFGNLGGTFTLYATAADGTTITTAFAPAC